MFDDARIKLGEIVSRVQPSPDPLTGKVMPRDFYDRTEVSNDACDCLQGDKAQVLMLLGGRRAGKTSQIRRLKRYFADSQPNRFGFIEITWAGISSQAELMQRILEATRTYISGELGLQEALASIAAVYPATTSAFLTAMEELLALSPGRRFILAIDEFDSILVESTKATGGREEAAGIVGMMHALAAEPNLRVRLLLSVAKLPDALIGECALPLTASAIVSRLQHFPRHEMDAMVLDIIQDAQPVSVADLDWIFELSGGWPYYAKLILKCMADLPHGPDQLRQALAVAVQHEGASQTIANVYYVHFDAEQKRLVLLLAQQGGRISATQWGTLNCALQTAARQLAEKDFVQMEPGGGCRFRIGFLAYWFPKWSQYELELERRVRHIALS